MKKIFLCGALFIHPLLFTAQTGNIGINTTTPQSMLHILKNGTSGGPFHTNASILLESDLTTYFQFSQGSGGIAGILSGNNLTPIRSALIFGIDSSLLFNTGGDFTRMKINKSGSIGIGTVAPNDAALIEMQSTSKGLLIPRMTSEQRILIPVPVAGLLVYDITAKTIFMHNGISWQPFALVSGTVQNTVTALLPVTGIYNNAEFGSAVAIDGDYAIVGAPKNAPNSTLVFGSITFYSETSGGWTEVLTTFAPNAENGDNFGLSVDIDFPYAIAGLPNDDIPGMTNRGRVVIYFFDGTTWTVQAELTGNAAGQLFGSSVALNHGNTAAVGMPGTNKVRIFTRSGTTWSQVQEISNSESDFGGHLEFSEQKIVIGSFNTGTGGMRIYKFNGTSWVQEQSISSLSYAQSLDMQGNEVIIGTSNDGVRIYSFNGTSWSFQQSIYPNDWEIENTQYFGQTVSIEGDYMLVGAPRYSTPGNSQQGAVYVFKRNGYSWIQVERITQINAQGQEMLGKSMDIEDKQYIIGSPFGNPTTGDKGGVNFGKIY